MLAKLTLATNSCLAVKRMIDGTRAHQGLEETGEKNGAACSGFLVVYVHVYDYFLTSN